MNSEFNANVSETVRRMTFAAAIVAAVFFAAAYASSAVAMPGSGAFQAAAPASASTISGTIEQVRRKPKIISVRRAFLVRPDEGISPASCWITYEKWGEVFYQTCPL
jgi:hypothetical protein